MTKKNENISGNQREKPLTNNGEEKCRDYIGILRDITERKRVESELKEAKEAAEAANRAKSRFLANMTHEIRTPMNAIIGVADLLGETRLTPLQQEYVRVFRSTGETLLSLIDNILDISKVEADRLELEMIDFDLRELIENACEIMALRAHEKGLELACRILPGVPRHVKGDPVRLRQILSNLIGNAVKFTTEGEVIVSVRSCQTERNLLLQAKKTCRDTETVKWHGS
jgi:signal transduction histidine kinase